MSNVKQLPKYYIRIIAYEMQCTFKDYIGRTKYAKGKTINLRAE
jgi:hypothetical protein